jgi:dTDP-4-dehydrorhamnose reductase
VFEDRTVSPTYVPDAARAMRHLIERESPGGVYHCVSSGLCTWLEFAIEAARIMGREPRVQRVRVADVTLRAERPKFCALSNAKLVATGFEMPSWQDALTRYLAM